METMTIGKLATQTGVGIETIRYYEKRRLVLPIKRRSSGYRVYDLSSFKRIRFIKNAQGLGFTLDEISGLLRLRVKKGTNCGAVKRKAEVKIAEIEKKIRALNAMKGALSNLLKRCRKDLSTDDCPILDSLDGAGENGVTACRR